MVKAELIITVAWLHVQDGINEHRLNLQVIFYPYRFQSTPPSAPQSPVPKQVGDGESKESEFQTPLLQVS